MREHAMRAHVSFAAAPGTSDARCGRAPLRRTKQRDAGAHTMRPTMSLIAVGVAIAQCGTQNRCRYRDRREAHIGEAPAAARDAKWASRLWQANSQSDQREEL